MATPITTSVTTPTSAATSISFFKRQRLMHDDTTRSSNITNPFDSQLIESLSEDTFSPSVFKRKCKKNGEKTKVKTSPSSFWSIEHVSIIRPINIDESEVNDTSDADQEDPSFEAKAQAAIDQYWAKKFIAPSPGMFTTPPFESSLTYALNGSCKPNQSNYASTCSSSATSAHTSPEFQPQDTHNVIQRISFSSDTEYREMTAEERELEDSFCSTNSDRIVADLDELYVERLFQISPIDGTDDDPIMESDPGFAFPKLDLSPIKFIHHSEV